MPRRYHSQARTLPVRARDGDSGREKTDKDSYFRCWHCGFICDIRRDLLSKDGKHATVLSEGTATSHGDTNLNHAVGAAVYLSPGVDEDSVLISGVESKARSITVGGGGCPFCHTTRWRT